MNWTTEKPAEPGWYWVKCTKYLPKRGDVEIIRFDKTLFEREESHPIQPTSGGLSTEGWDEFAGPIPLPST